MTVLALFIFFGILIGIPLMLARISVVLKLHVWYCLFFLELINEILLSSNIFRTRLTCKSPGNLAFVYWTFLDFIISCIFPRSLTCSSMMGSTVSVASVRSTILLSISLLFLSIFDTCFSCFSNLKNSSVSLLFCAWTLYVVLRCRHLFPSRC